MEQADSFESIYICLKFIHNRLSIKDDLIRHVMTRLGSLFICLDNCGKNETLNHLLFDCDFFGNF